MIGSGPSAWAVLNSLGNLDDVLLIDGGAKFSPANLNLGKHLGVKTKFGSNHAIAVASDFHVDDQSRDAFPASLSRGGLSEIWGNGFSPYLFSEISKELLIDDAAIQKSMREILDLIPSSNLNKNSMLARRFKLDSVIGSKNCQEVIPIHPLFESKLQGIKSQNQKLSILIDRPFFFLNSNSCTNCGLCMTGCPYGSLFDAGEKINTMILRNQILRKNVISGKVIRLERVGEKIKVYYTQNRTSQSILVEEVILSCGPLATAILLMNSNLIPNRLEIPDSQVFYFGLVSRKRFKQLPLIPDLGQLAIIPSDVSRGDFQVALYKPTLMSKNRISESLFGRFSSILKIPRFVSDRIVPAIGFLPQDKSGVLVLEKDGAQIRLIRKKNHESNGEIRKIIKEVKPLLRDLGFYTPKFSLRIPDPGSGFHLGASLPLGGEIIDMNGRLRNEQQVRIMDPSLLPTLPAGAHTFLTMSLIRLVMRSEK